MKRQGKAQDGIAEKRDDLAEEHDDEIALAQRVFGCLHYISSFVKPTVGLYIGYGKPLFSERLSVQRVPSLACARHRA